MFFKLLFSILCELSLQCMQLFTIKEEDRLAGLIAEINHDVRIVPRGAYMMTEKGAVVVNRTFEGQF